jgi:hypothetical protein
MAKNDNRLVLSAEIYFEDEATFVFEDGKLIVSVSEEKAMDSYNEMFECSLHLTAEQTKTLAGWLASKVA